MVENIQQVFSNSFGEFCFFATMLIAMIPICESRVAIPFGMAKEIWGEQALSPIVSFCASLVGGCIITAIILLLLKPIVKKLKQNKKFTKFAARLEAKFRDKTDQVLEDNDQIKHKTFNAWLSVMLFVATPAPMTGIWTGSAIACFTKLSFWSSFLAVSVGNVIGNIIIVLVCTILQEYIFVLLILCLLTTIVAVAFYYFNKHKKSNKKQV